MKKLTIKHLDNFAKKRDGKCLSKIYIKSRTKYKWKCKYNHIWRATANHIQQGEWCPTCLSKPWSDVELNFLRKNADKISSKDIAKKLKKTVISIRSKALQNNIPLTFSRKKFTEKDILLIKKMCGKFSTDQIGKKINRCKESIFQIASFHKISLRFKHKLWSNDDLKILRKWAGRISTLDIAKKLNRPISGVKDKANNNKIELRFFHKKVSDFDINYVKRNAGKLTAEEIANNLNVKVNRILGIAYTNKISLSKEKYPSKGEFIIEKVLKKLGLKKNIDFIPEYRFKICKNKNPLPFDIYLPKYNMLLEFDGQQHFNRKKGHWGDLTKHLKTQENDQIKNKFCYNHRKKMIRIPYNMENMVEKILTREYDRGFPRSINYSEKLL